jgi:hypothetical protein
VLDLKQNVNLEEVERRVHGWGAHYRGIVRLHTRHQMVQKPVADNSLGGILEEPLEVPGGRP